jgi:hypothetical protein
MNAGLAPSPRRRNVVVLDALTAPWRESEAELTSNR